MATLMQKLIDEIANIGPLPLPDMAPLVAYWAVASIAGKAYRCGSTANASQGLNIYAMIIAPPSSGKSKLLNGVKKFMADIGNSDIRNEKIRNYYTNANYGSPQGLKSDLYEHPVRGVIWDEVSYVLKAYLRNADHNLGSEILSIYDAPEAGVPSNKVADRNKVVPYNKSASLSILGGIQPGVWSGLSGVEMLSSGLISRFLFCRCGHLDRDKAVEIKTKINNGLIQEKDNKSLPPEIKSKFEEILRISEDRITPMQYNLKNKIWEDIPGYWSEKPPIRVNFDCADTANLLVKEIDNRISEVLSHKSVKNKDNSIDLVLSAIGRSEDQVCKLAALSAVLQNPSNPIINAEMVVDAINVVCSSVDHLFMFNSKSEESSIIDQVVHYEDVAKQVLIDFVDQQPDGFMDDATTWFTLKDVALGTNNKAAFKFCKERSNGRETPSNLRRRLLTQLEEEGVIIRVKECTRAKVWIKNHTNHGEGHDEIDQEKLAALNEQAAKLMAEMAEEDKLAAEEDEDPLYKGRPNLMRADKESGVSKEDRINLNKMFMGPPPEETESLIAELRGYSRNSGDK